MTYDPDRDHRRSIRLRGYDYAMVGAYFVTLCAQDRACVFGTAMGHTVDLTPAGQMVADGWGALPGKFATVALDAFVVMPNHFHGIVVLAAADPTPQPDRTPDQGGHVGPPLHPDGSAAAGAERRIALPQMIQWFKTMTTNAYFRGVKEAGWPPCRGRLWQRNYYERIIRNDRELDALRAYIIANPARWAADPDHV